MLSLLTDIKDKKILIRMTDIVLEDKESETLTSVTIACVIDNAESLFGKMGYYSDGKFTGITRMREAYDRVEEFKKELLFRSYEEIAESIFKSCQQDRPLEEIEQYIIDNLK